MTRVALKFNMDNSNDRESHVLVFDDNDVDRLAVCLALMHSGFAGVVHDTGSAPRALEDIETTNFDCVYIGDSTARTHLLSVLVALHRVGYRGRIVIVAYGLEPHPVHSTGVVIDFLAITRLTPKRLAENC